MDRRETDFKTDELVVRQDDNLEAPPKSLDLLRQGEELYARGLYHQAIHLWTRILFLDRGNPEARLRIDEAKEAVAERQRRIDAEVAEARGLFDAGEIEGARERVRSVLAGGSHGEAAQLAAAIAALDRRNEAPSDVSREAGALAAPTAALAQGVVFPAALAQGVVFPATPAQGVVFPATPAQGVVFPATPAQGVVFKVPKGPRQRSHRAVATATSRFKMAAFLLGALLLFAISAFYLGENWEAIVSDGAFGRPTGLGTAAPPDRLAASVPDLSELRYYNGERLFAQGRYREALAELRRVDRDSAVVAEARSLILRIEDRLLRGPTGPEPAIDRAR